MKRHRKKYLFIALIFVLPYHTVKICTFFIQQLNLGLHSRDFIPSFDITLRKADFLLYFAEFIKMWVYAILHRATYRPGKLA